MNTSKVFYQPTLDANGVEHFDPFCDFMRTHCLMHDGWPGRARMVDSFMAHFAVDEETAFFIIDKRITVNFGKTGMTLFNQTMNEEESALYERYKAKSLLRGDKGRESTGEME